MHNDGMDLSTIFVHQKHRHRGCIRPRHQDTLDTSGSGGSGSSWGTPSFWQISGCSRSCHSLARRPTDLWTVGTCHCGSVPGGCNFFQYPTVPAAVSLGDQSAAKMGQSAAGSPYITHVTNQKLAPSAPPNCPKHL